MIIAVFPGQGSQSPGFLAPWLELVRKLGLLAGTLSPEAVQNVQVVASGELSAENVDILGLAALRGLFSASSDEAVTFVNAPQLAEQRGVSVEVEKHSEAQTHRSAVEVRAVAADGTVTTVAGALTGLQQVEKIVNINGRSFDLRAEGHNIVVHYTDRPGVLGVLGTVLGTAGIDIQAAALSQDAEGEGATVILRVDRVVGDAEVAQIVEQLDARVAQVDLS